MSLPVLSGTALADEHAFPTDASPPEITAWAISRFELWRIAITTAFGMEGCALIDMIARTGRPMHVAYLDTHFLFPETLALRDRLVRRYPHLTFVNEGTRLTPGEQAESHGDRLWESDPDTCCRLRKVEPMHRVLRGHDVWLTAIRREQSATRSQIRVIEWDWKFDVLKVSPMARWSRADVWTYIQDNDVPYNSLHDRGYPTVGCTHCTTPVTGTTAADYSREGRWRGKEKTECGLHGGAEGVVAI